MLIAETKTLKLYLPVGVPCFYKLTPATHYWTIAMSMSRPVKKILGFKVWRVKYLPLFGVDVVILSLRVKMYLMSWIVCIQKLNV